MISQLPIDLVVNDIFTKLPAKTLLCLKSVCKLWYALISDDKFVNLHLEVSIATETNLHYVITTPRLYMQQFDHRPDPLKISCPILYSADFDTLGNPIELSHPYKYCKNCVWVVGSCRGLLLLRVGNGDPLLLYNPTTQTYNVLPHLPVSKEAIVYAHYTYGFGYDSVIEDYKCVRIYQCLDHETRVLRCQVMVYSLNDNCWRTVADVPYYFRTLGSGFGALLNGKCHWVGVNDVILNIHVYEPIVVFSLRDESFSSLPLPNIHYEEYDDLYLGTLDGCLCLMINRYLHCHVWVMKEYGVAGSWTRMFTFEKWQCYDFEGPIGYTLDKKRLFLMKAILNRLVYLDLETMEISPDVTFTDCDIGLNAHIYVENLLMLDYAEFADGFRNRMKEVEYRKNKKRRNRRRRSKKNGSSEKIQVEALRREVQETSQQLEMVMSEKAKVESELKSLSDTYFELEKQVRLLQIGEQSKVGRLTARLLEFGEDVDKLLEGTGDDDTFVAQD